MGLWSFLTGSNNNEEEEDSEYDRGYAASKEFVELMDVDVTDDQLRQQWDIVEKYHSEEYNRGYNDYVEDELAKHWWQKWF
jgi:hypothetical protein